MIDASDDVELIDRVDPRSGTVSIVATTGARLRAASFLDGRAAFATGPTRIEPMPTAPSGPRRAVPTLLHVSFCGSTFLSRLLDIPGRTLVLREPRAQIDLADWRAEIGVGPEPAAFPEALTAVTAALGRSGTGEIVVIKPTNWANLLLPAWSRAAASIDPIFLTMAPDAFLTAVFRGGRDRLSFTMRAAAHFARVRPGGDALIASAIAASPEPLDRAARMAIVALGLQYAFFTAARQGTGWDESRTIDHAALRADPPATAARVARLLHLPLTEREIEARYDTLSGQDAKAPGRGFAIAAERDADDQVTANHGARIRQALRWGERSGLLPA